jgi:hypothetical protein
VKKLLLISLLFTLILESQGQSADAREEINSDRPDQSDSPFLVPRGSLQVETGFYIERDRTIEINSSNVAFHSSLLRYGVNENIELRLVSEYLGRYVEHSGVVTSKSGFSPLVLGMKLRLADESGIWPQIGFTSHIKLRAGSSGFVQSNTTTNLRFVFAHNLTSRWVLNYNVGAEWNGETPQAIFLGTLSMSFLLNETLSVFGEVYSFFPEHSAIDNRADGGLTLRVTPVVQLDLAGGIGLDEHSPDFYVTTGVSFRLFK